MTAPAKEFTPPAQAARPQRTVQVATGQRGIGREKALATRYLDAHLIDRLHHAGQINDRAYAAARVLLTAWSSSGIAPALEPAWASAQFGRAPAAPQGVDGTEGAEDRYHALLRPLSGAYAVVLSAMVRGEHPGVRWLATLQAALDALANRLGIDPGYAHRDPEWEEA